MTKLLFCLVAFVISNLALAIPPRFVVDIIASKPLGYHNANGARAGIHYDILNELSRETGIPIDIHIVPKARAFAELEMGAVDAAILFPTAKINKFAIDAGMTDNATLVALGKIGAPLKNYNDLVQARTLLLLANTTFGPQMDSDSRLTKYRADSYDQMVAMFMHNRAKVITGNLAILLFQLKEQGGENLIDPSALQFGEIANHLFISKSSSKVGEANTILKTLQDMTKNGTVDKILVKYEGRHWKNLELHPDH